MATSAWSREFTFQLHPVGLLLGGQIDFRYEDAPVALTRWRDVMANAPDLLASFGQVYRSPLAGQAGANLSFAWLGSVDEGNAVIAELTEGLTPTPEHRAAHALLRAPGHLRANPVRSAELLVGPVPRRAPGRAAHADDRDLPRPGNGRRRPDRADARCSGEDRVRCHGVRRTRSALERDVPQHLDRSGDEDEPEIEKARAFSRSLEPWRIGGGYLNYANEAASDSLETEFGAERFRRLLAVKRELDPANVFRFNHNIATA